MRLVSICVPRLLRHSCTLAMLVIAASTAAAQPVQLEVTSRLTIPRVTIPPRLEDYLDGVPRPDEAAVAQFYQREPGDGVPSSQPTEAYVSYDQQNLYVVFIARDAEPSKIRANMTKRENVMGDDLVGVLLDTYHDRHRSYELITNPLGIQLDGVATEGQNDDFSFDTVWHSEGKLTSFGYVVFMAIPFRSLRFSSDAVQEWGIGFVRSIPRNNETSFWPYMTRRITGFTQQLATGEGLHDLSAGRNLQFIPYGAFTGARLLDPSTAARTTERDARGGIDAKAIVRDSFTVDATFNPDFSQVESDEPQVTINQRFEVFFPEKRPFFIENASFFSTPLNLFHSRRIVDPQFGGRVTGRTGGWAVGGLAIDDRAAGESLKEGEPGSGNRAGIGVFRLQRELPRQSNIGVLATLRNFATSDNWIVGADGRWKMNDNWVANGQAVYSQTSPKGGAGLSGQAFKAEISRNSRNFSYEIEYTDIAPGFRAPLGYIRRVDMREISQGGDYRWRPKNGPLLSFGPEAGANALWSHDGTLQNWEAGAEFSFELRGGTNFDAGYDESMERYEGIEFRKREVSLRFETAIVKWLEVSTHYRGGDEINYYPAGGLAPFLGDGVNLESGATFKIASPLRIDETYLYTRLSPKAEFTAAPASSDIVSNHILRTRGSYQFTRELSLRAILDYSTVLPDSNLIALDREKRFTADVLVTYLVNPWTAFYVGYNDGYENLGIDPAFRNRLARTGNRLTSTGRQFFVKASYLFRF